MLDNVSSFFDAFNTYLNGYFNDWLEYFASLIIKLDTDIINYGDAISSYIGDLISVFDHNVQIILSNFEQYLNTQFVPDKDVVDFMLRDCIGWYHQIQDLLASKSYERSSFTLHISAFDYTYVFDDAALASNIKSVARLVITVPTMTV